MADKIVKFKIAGMPKDSDYAKLPFGRQIEHRHAIESFKARAKKIHLSQKRQTYAKSIREALTLENATEYFCTFYCSSDCKDDTFEFWFA